MTEKEKKHIAKVPTKCDIEGTLRNLYKKVEERRNETHNYDEKDELLGLGSTILCAIPPTKRTIKLVLEEIIKYSYKHVNYEKRIGNPFYRDEEYELELFYEGYYKGELNETNKHVV